MALGQLTTSEPIDKAMRVIREWLDKLSINGMAIDLKYDAKINIALLRFNYKGKNYEFRSTKQTNSRLNMWAISRVMEYKVRSHIMGIEEFDKSMVAYLMIEGTAGSSQSMPIKEKNYAVLGLDSTCSNEEIVKTYKKLAKSWHPDMANSEESKEVFLKRFSEITEAYTEVCKERGIQ